MERIKTIEVDVAGKIKIGGENPVAIQSMTNTYNKDTEKTYDQILTIYQAGAKLVRLTLPTAADLKNVEIIKQKLDKTGYSAIPLIADIHFSPKVAVKAAAIFDKIRINPGNYAEARHIKDIKSHIKQQLEPLVSLLKKEGKALRVGVNHGSLSERMLEKYGDTEEGMVNSALEYLDILQEFGFDNVIVSLKATKPKVVVYANRLIVRKFKERGIYYPLHLGVTEAGYGMDGRIKSAVGIGVLLAEGIGDTIRVSLTEPPQDEVRPARIILDYATQLLESSVLPSYYSPVSYEKKSTKEILGIGGNNKPTVFYFVNGGEKPAFEKDLEPDFLLKVVDNEFKVENYKTGEAYDAYRKENYEITGQDKFLVININDLDFNLAAKLKADSRTVTILLMGSENPIEQQQKLYKILDKFGIETPVVFARNYEDADYEGFYIKAAIDMSYSFINGYGNGIMISNHNFSPSEITKVAFKILQATGDRINFTEYIACPSCGRTLFDIEQTTKKIEAKTKHLKGVKIAVMGCIVNGLGEMADADYGYVGTSPGKISLYRNRELIKKDIPEENAVEELLKLIEEDRKRE